MPPALLLVGQQTAPAVPVVNGQSWWRGKGEPFPAAVMKISVWCSSTLGPPMTAAATPVMRSSTMRREKAADWDGASWQWSSWVRSAGHLPRRAPRGVDVADLLQAADQRVGFAPVALGLGAAHQALDQEVPVPLVEVDLSRGHRRCALLLRPRGFDDAGHRPAPPSRRRRRAAGVAREDPREMRDVEIADLGRDRRDRQRVLLITVFQNWVITVTETARRPWSLWRRRYRRQRHAPWRGRRPAGQPTAPPPPPPGLRKPPLSHLP